jgi:hypothetical protein
MPAAQGEKGARAAAKAEAGKEKTLKKRCRRWFLKELSPLLRIIITRYDRKTAQAGRLLGIMRFVSFAALVAGCALMAVSTAEAKPRKYENREHYSITVHKHRSFLDAGTQVSAGEKSYHDYHRLLTDRYPTYGPAGPEWRNGRWPLPGPYDGAPY